MVAIFVAYLLCLGPPAQAQAESKARGRVYVYVHTPLSARALENALQEALPTLDVTVYGRHRDFEKAIKASPPDAALARGIVLESLGLPISLRGTRNDERAESYSLLSLNKPIGPADAVTKTIGAVDLLGRKKMGAFVSGLLGTKSTVQVSLVTKLEDLLSLLSLEVADVIVLPEDLVATLKKSSHLGLHVTTLPAARVALPSLAVINQANSATIIHAFQRMDTRVLTSIGVESWQKE